MLRKSQTDKRKQLKFADLGGELLRKHFPEEILLAGRYPDALKGLAETKCILTNEFESLGESDFLEIFAIKEGVWANSNQTLVETHLLERKALSKGVIPYYFKGGRTGNAFKGPAVLKGTVTDGNERRRKLDALDIAAFTEGAHADMRNGIRKLDLVKRRYPVFLRHLLPCRDIFLAHIILEGKGLVTDYSGTFTDCNFRRKNKRIQELLSVCAVIDTVLVVPDVVCPVLNKRSGIDAYRNNVTKTCHIKERKYYESFEPGPKFLTYSMSFLSITLGSIRETFWKSLKILRGER